MNGPVCFASSVDRRKAEYKELLASAKQYADTIDLSAETLEATHSVEAAIRFEDHLSKAATHQIDVFVDGAHWESSTFGKHSQCFLYETFRGKGYTTKHQAVGKSDEHLAAMGVSVKTFDD